MATRFELVLQGDREPHLRAAGEEALAEIQLWHQRLSWFEPSSFLSHLNRHGATRPVKCDGEVFELLTLCKSLARQTRHHFNPALGAMMVAAGFRGSPRNESAGAIEQRVRLVQKRPLVGLVGIDGDLRRGLRSLRRFCCATITGSLAIRLGLDRQD